MLAASNSLRFRLAKMIWKKEQRTRSQKTWASILVALASHYGTLSVLSHRMKTFHLYLEVCEAHLGERTKGFVTYKLCEQC